MVLHPTVRFAFARVIIGVALLAASFTLKSQPAAAFKINVDHFKLDNGMQVVVIPDHRAPVVTHMVWYRVGSADEPKGKAGIAHFLEHLLFKGTKKIAPGEFSKRVKRNGGEDNAFTSKDFTAYFQRISKDRLDLVMGMEADRMVNLQLTDKDVLTELDVIKEERRSRIDNDPAGLLREQLNASLYVAHPYRKPVIGWMAEVFKLDREAAMDFYRQYYTPSNAILIVAGDVTGAEVRKLAMKHFAPLKNTAQPGPRVRTPEPEPIAARRVTLEDPRVAATIVQRIYLTPSYATADKGEAEALDVLAQIVGGGATSLLYRKMVVEDKIATYAGAWFTGDGLDGGTIGFYVAPALGQNVDAIERRLEEIIAEIAKNGVSEERVKRAKARLVADAIYSLDSQYRLAYAFGTALTSGETVEAVMTWPDRIKSVEAETIRKVAGKWLKTRRSTTGILIKPQAAK